MVEVETKTKTTTKVDLETPAAKPRNTGGDTLLIGAGLALLALFIPAIALGKTDAEKQRAAEEALGLTDDDWDKAISTPPEESLSFPDVPIASLAAKALRRYLKMPTWISDSWVWEVEFDPAKRNYTKLRHRPIDDYHNPATGMHPISLYRDETDWCLYIADSIETRRINNLQDIYNFIGQRSNGWNSISWLKAKKESNMVAMWDFWYNMIVKNLSDDFYLELANSTPSAWLNENA